MYRIVDWGPGYQQGPKSGEIGVLIEDPTGVLLPKEGQRLVLRRFPWYNDGVKIVVVGGLHGTPDAVRGQRGDRLVEYLLEHQGDEIREHFDACPDVGNCDPASAEIDAWVYEGVTLFYTSPHEPSEFGFNPLTAVRDGEVV